MVFNAIKLIRWCNLPSYTSLSFLSLFSSSQTYVSSQHLNSNNQLSLHQMAEEERKKCIFCKIADGVELNDIVYEDEELVMFPDIKPATPHHYLVIPRQHLPSAKYLTSEHHDLVSRMVEVGQRVTEERSGCEFEELRLGFHWPPFNSIAHLHLHVIAPQSSMGLIARGIFKPNSFWFVPADTVLRGLGTAKK